MVSPKYLAAIAAAAFVVACGDTLPAGPTVPPKPVGQATAAAIAPGPTKAPQPASGEPISIGVITSLTGADDRYGALQRRGYEMAVEEVNAAGGIGGRPLELVVEDDASNHELSVLVAEKLITQDKLPLLIGAYGNTTTATAAPAATRYQTPLIIPSGSDDATLEHGSQWLFRICAPSSGFAKSAIDFLADVPKTGTVAIVYENTSLGQSSSAAAKKAAEEKGMRIVAFESYRPGGGDFEPVLRQVKAASPEAILFASDLSDAMLLMGQSKELDLNPKVFIGAGAGFGEEDFVKPEGAGKNAEYTFASSQWTPDSRWPGAKETGERYLARHGEQPRYQFAEAYSAIEVAADALKRSGSLDRAKIRDALARTDMMTMFGPIRFDQAGQNDHPMTITQVQDGRFVAVYPKGAAAGDPKLPAPPWSERP